MSEEISCHCVKVFGLYDVFWMLGGRILFNDYVRKLSDDKSILAKLCAAEPTKLVAFDGGRLAGVPDEICYFCYAEDVIFLFGKFYYAERGARLPYEPIGSDSHDSNSYSIVLEPKIISDFKLQFEEQSKTLFPKVESVRSHLLVEKLQSVAESIAQNRKIGRAVKRKFTQFAQVIEGFEIHLPYQANE